MSDKKVCRETKSLSGLNATDFFKHSHLALLFACMKGLHGEVESILNMFNSTDLDVECLVNQSQTDGWTALHYAASTGQTQIVKTLLSHRALVNVATRLSRSTALHLAAKRGHVDIVQLLLHKFAKNRKDSRGWTALKFAEKTFWRNVVAADLQMGEEILHCELVSERKSFRLSKALQGCDACSCSSPPTLADVARNGAHWSLSSLQDLTLSSAPTLAAHKHSSPAEEPAVGLARLKIFKESLPRLIV
ncbi:hypothetical protein GUITHDRAFT_146321 [Guillardia theta CCMP2712]|uniref:Uncharacterized protein n=1 Tax=Guillardia theta (strain CCMP2712) TaxID=905079 RepID=L1IHF6_GUITC|nr:hypothetical protein GUITHDRAFT_146321 [Guillardia theta CCMP2712]EKX35686.1 hypothetical protein GUITHDRAFT_146321 [Guillardia theta CCMP2712]|eukprot:XP_005822666.1 hypothetical protein GUITHDRAFT_146321 [Guillardia theta CCMP2712]